MLCTPSPINDADRPDTVASLHQACQRRAILDQIDSGRRAVAFEVHTELASREWHGDQRCRLQLQLWLAVQLLVRLRLLRLQWVQLLLVWLQLRLGVQLLVWLQLLLGVQLLLLWLQVWLLVWLLGVQLRVKLLVMAWLW